MEKTTALGPVTETPWGFQVITFKDHSGDKVELQQSSAIGPYDDAIDRPGSSYVWLGSEYYGRVHLSRDHVLCLIDVLATWLRTGRFDKEVTHATETDGAVAKDDRQADQPATG